MTLPHTASVIITYYPDKQVSRLIYDLLQQTQWVIVVDNTEGESAFEVSALDHDRLIFVANRQNLGIARALNQGLDFARVLGCRWAFTFDQDSLAPLDFCAVLHRHLIQASQKNPVLLAAPIYRHPQTGLEYRFGSKGSTPAWVDHTLTSGNLLVLEPTLALGGFREDYFIDYVDLEFNVRARSAGYLLLEVPQAVLEHNLGQSERVRFLNKSDVLVTNHSPLRRYYNTRNRVRTSLDYGLRQPAWVARDLLGFIKEMTKVTLYEREVSRKWRAVLWGLLDGLLGRLGKAGRSL